MLIIDERKLDFDDVLIVPKRSTLTSRKDVDLNRTFTFKHSKVEWTGIPIMASNMDGVGTILMAKKLAELGLFTCLTKDWNATFIRDLEGLENNFAITMGIKDEDLQRTKTILEEIPAIKFICVDVANGYTQRFAGFIQELRKLYPNKVIIAGNVVTREMTEQLIMSGADIVKVGIGPGSVCTTRIQTGIGYPQLSAIIECADAAHGLGARIIADGGCTCPGDVAKAFGAGADFVMLGGMLAGHDEGMQEVHTEYVLTDRAEPDWERKAGGISRQVFIPIYEEKKFVYFYGMSSAIAAEKHSGGLKNYRSAEGRVVKIPYRGAVATTIQDILGGIRSTCTYVGAEHLKDLPKCTTFIRVSKQYNDIFGGKNV